MRGDRLISCKNLCLIWREDWTWDEESILLSEMETYSVSGPFEHLRAGLWGLIIGLAAAAWWTRYVDIWTSTTLIEFLAFLGKGDGILNEDHIQYIDVGKHNISIIV